MRPTLCVWQSVLWALPTLVLAAPASADIVRHDFAATIYSGGNSNTYPNAPGTSSSWYSSVTSMPAPLSVGDRVIGSVWIDLDDPDSIADADRGSYPNSIAAWSFAITDSGTGDTLLSTSGSGAGGSSGNVSTRNDSLDSSRDKDEFYIRLWDVSDAGFAGIGLKNILISMHDFTTTVVSQAMISDAIPAYGVDTGLFPFRRIAFNFDDPDGPGDIRVVAEMDVMNTAGVVTPSAPTFTGGGQAGSTVPLPGALALFAGGALLVSGAALRRIAA